MGKLVLSVDKIKLSSQGRIMNFMKNGALGFEEGIIDLQGRDTRSTTNYNMCIPIATIKSYCVGKPF